MTDQTETVEQTADRLVRNEVFACLSRLVSTLAGNDFYDIDSREVQKKEFLDLANQADELVAPVDDWEEAARQDGWSEGETQGTYVHEDMPADDYVYYDDWADLCERNGLSPYYRAVLEHWAVSPWLGEKLAAHGEKVDSDFAGLVVWARTCTGQSISSDDVILAIAKEVRAA